MNQDKENLELDPWWDGLVCKPAAEGQASPWSAREVAAAAAAAAKSHQLCSTLCNPIDCSPPSSSVPGKEKKIAACPSRGLNQDV